VTNKITTPQWGAIGGKWWLGGLFPPPFGSEVIKWRGWYGHTHPCEHM